MSPRPPGCTPGASDPPIRGTSPQGRLSPPPAGLCPARLLPMPIRPWLRCHPTREAPQSPAPPPGHPWPLTWRDRAHRAYCPVPGSRAAGVLTREGMGRPASVGDRGQVGTRRGSSPRSTTGRGGAASLRSAPASGARTLPPSYSLSGSPDPLTVPIQRARAPARRQAPPPTSPPLSGEARSGESAGLSRDALSQRSLR